MSAEADVNKSSPAIEEPQSKEETAVSTPDVTSSTTTVAASNMTLQNDTVRSTRRISVSDKRRRSSIFERARASFYRSRGQNGASVETLRGTTGSDFEGFALVERCSDDGLGLDCNPFSCCCGHKDGLYFLLVKGYHCFVFKDEDGVAPKFAIELNHRKAALQPKHDANHCIVHLQTSLGDVEYKFTFAKSHLDENDTVRTPDAKAGAFVTAVSAASSAAQSDEVRTRLGHQGLLDKRGSVRFAINIGKEKAKQQPEKPVGMGEVMREMPVAGGF